MVVCSSGEGNNSSRPRRTTAVLECAQCRRKFLNEADRQLHIREAHQGLKESFECNQCGKQFGNRHILQLHTRLHASQSTSPSSDSPLSDAIAITSTTQANGSLSINFNVSLSINLSDGVDSLDIDSKLNELLANATRRSFQEALRREKKLAQQDNPTSGSSQGSATTEQPDQVSTSPASSPSKSDTSETESVATSVAGSNSPSTASNEENREPVNVNPVPTEVTPKPEPVVLPKPPVVRVNPHNRPKKAVGLTKIRMEDCQRCDACSCIYLDERDYIKHMKNFHKMDVTKKEPVQIKVRSKSRKKNPAHVRKLSKRQQVLHQKQLEQAAKKGNCRSCCKSCKCRGDSGTLEPLLPIVRPILGRSGRRGSSSSTQESWNQFTQHLEGVEGIEIKSDPDAVADFSDLLSQVEVKIKTEPVDHDDQVPVRVKLEPADEMDDDCSVY